MTNIAKRMTGLFMALFLLLSFGAMPAQAQGTVNVYVQPCQMDPGKTCVGMSVQGGGVEGFDARFNPPVGEPAGEYAPPAPATVYEPVRADATASPGTEEPGLDDFWPWLASPAGLPWILGALVVVFAALLFFVRRKGRPQSTTGTAADEREKRLVAERDMLAASLATAQGDLGVRTQELEAAQRDLVARTQELQATKDDCAKWALGQVNLRTITKQYAVTPVRTTLEGGKTVRWFTTPFTTGAEVVKEDDLEDHLLRQGKP